MALLSPGFIDQAQLAAAVDNAKAKLDEKEVKLVNYNVGVDSMGEIDIFFRILLTDYGSQEARLGDVTTRVSTILFNEIKPFENWGVLPEFHFRSEAEQRARFDPGWD